MIVPPGTVTGPGSRGSPTNHQDQATIANLPGHKTAKACCMGRSVIVMAEATLAEGGLARRRWVLLWVIQPGTPSPARGAAQVQAQAGPGVPA